MGEKVHSAVEGVHTWQERLEMGIEPVVRSCDSERSCVTATSPDTEQTEDDRRHGGKESQGNAGITTVAASILIIAGVFVVALICLLSLLLLYDLVLGDDGQSQV